MDIHQLAIDLINIESVTGNEREVAEYLAKYCRTIGFADCELEKVEENRFNVFAGWKKGSQPKVVFNTHIDTVPPFIPARRDGDTIYGRGACDTKGIIASMLTAAELLISEGEFPALCFVVGEELDSIGAKAAASSGRKAGFIIVGEPTDNMLVAGHKGSLGYRIDAQGIAGHSAFPERGKSAVEPLLDILEEIRAADWGEDGLLGPSTLNIGKLEAGVAMNVFAERASATLLHRIVDDMKRRKAQVLEIVRDRAEVTYLTQAEPQRMHVVDGFKTKVVSFGTDIPYLREMGTPLLIGPGSILDAHTEDEKITIQQMNEAVEIYKRLYFTLKEEA